MQTLARHWRLFLPLSDSLTFAQKLHYLQGWAPWLRDAILVGSSPLALTLGGYSLLIVGNPAPVEPLAKAVLTVTIYLLMREFVVYRLFLRRSWPDTLGAVMAVVGLVATAGTAVIASGLRPRRGFDRTPKVHQQVPLLEQRTTWEIAVVAAMALLATFLLHQFGMSGVLPATGILAYAALFGCSIATDLVSRR